MSKTIHIGSTEVGQPHPCFIIAEIGQNHDGSLGLAHSYIDAVADAGADAIKFQTHLADMESSNKDQFRIKFSKQDATRQDYWRRMEFTAEQWAGLADHAKQVGIAFLSSAFSIAAVDLLVKLNVPAWKVGSGEFCSHDLLDAMIKAGGPLLFSTGMSTWSEINAVVESFKTREVPHGLFQCTSQYPTPLEEVGLNVLDEMRAKADHPVGLSDHSGTIFPGMAAIARGFDMLEVHITFDKRMFGPDVVASITIEELELLCRARDALRLMDTNPIDKDAKALELSPMRSLFTKSLSPTRPLHAGEVLTTEMLTSKKPGTGIKPERIGELIGSRLKRDIALDELLSFDDIEEN